MLLVLLLQCLQEYRVTRYLDHGERIKEPARLLLISNFEGIHRKSTVEEEEEGR